MRTPTPPIRLAQFSAALLAFVSLTEISLLAQTASPAPAESPATTKTAPAIPTKAPATAALEEEPVQFSPFVVSADEDNGYASINTLSGSSLNTPLKDVAAQVSVFNQQFLSDIAATNLEEAFLYSSNVESSLEFVSADGNDNVGLGGGNRIRGLGEASNLRGLFETNIKPDAYNTERLTVASGANSILFGLANAGGSVDSTPQGGNFKNAGQVGITIDNFGTNRYVLNLNRVIIPKKLAVRFAALDQSKHYSREPSHDFQRRYYGAFTLQPFKNTTIRANTESIRRDASLASYVLPRDAVTLWLAGADKIRSTADDAPTFNNSGTAVSLPATNPTSALFVNTNQGSAPVFTYGNNDLSVDGPQFYRVYVETRAPSNVTSLPAFDKFPYSLNDTSIYDYRGVNTWGDVRRNDQKAYAHQATLEQRIGQNLFFQLGYARERVKERSGGYTGSTNTVLAAEIRADPNQFVNSGPGKVIPNPNVGKYYVEQRSIGQISIDGIEQLRAQMAYQLDFTHRPSFVRHLGRYTLGAGWSDTTKEEISQQFYRTIGGSPSWDPTGTLRHNYDPRRFRIRYYLDPEHPAATNPFPGTDVLETAYITDPGNGQLLPVYMFDAPNGGFRDAVFRRLNTITNKYTINGQLWQNRIMPFFGLSQSRIRRSDPYLIDNPTANPRGVGADGSGFFPRWDKLAHGPYNYWRQGDKTNWGVVVRPVPLFSLRYNQSENFKLNEDGALDPYGVPLPGGIGKSTDYGFRLHTADGKFNLSVNFYHNTQMNNRVSTADNNLVNNGLLQIETTVLNYNQLAGITTPLLGVDLATNGTNIYKGISDYDSRGIELDIDYNPTRNLNIKLGGNKKQAKDANLLGAWAEWAELRRPVWEGVAGGWDNAIVAFNGNTVHQEYDKWVASYAPLAASNGRLRENQSEYSLKLFANYTFTNPRLKGWDVGAGVRWSSANVIGYGLLAGAPVTTIDINHKYTGDEDLDFDFKLGYRFKIAKAYKMRVQLNVRNAFRGANELRAIRALTNGSIGLLQAIEPRVITLTTNLDF